MKQEVQFGSKKKKKKNPDRDHKVTKECQTQNTKGISFQQWCKRDSSIYSHISTNAAWACQQEERR